MTIAESNDDSGELDKIISDLEKETLSEDSSVPKSEEIKDKQASETVAKIKYKKPDWADKKDDADNSYEYSEKQDENDSEW